MRTFILRARKGKTSGGDGFRMGGKDHVEILAQTLLNTFFVSNGFRTDVTLHVVLDSTADFPRTISLMGSEGLSFPGFDEQALLSVIGEALKSSAGLQKNEVREVARGVRICGHGFEKLIEQFLPTRPVFLLDPRGSDIMTTEIAREAVFILSDHLALPKNMVKSLRRRGLQTLSVGKKMLFASQCIVLIHAALDRQESHS